MWNIYVCEHMYIYVSSSWGNMLETRNPDNITGNLEICWASLPLLRRGKRKRKLQQLRF